MSARYAVTALYAGERVFCDHTGGFRTTPVVHAFGPLIRDAYFTALADPRLTDVLIEEMS